MIKKIFLRAKLVGGLAILALAVSQPASAMSVDLELQMLVDVSGSVNSTEFNLQRSGYSDAFRNASIQNTIANGAIGSIAAQLIYWSSASKQAIGVDWALIDDVASSNAFADAIDNAARPFSGSTAPQSALAYGTPLFSGNGYEGTRMVVDVSGDGGRNSGLGGAAGRDAALGAGITTINGIVIGGSSSVLAYYTDNIIGGTNAFVMEAVDFNAFGAAVMSKLEREIGGGGTALPEPSTLPLIMIGMVIFAVARRYVRN